jgi:CHAD domain-containing protein
MKAQKVKGLDPNGPLGQNLRRIVEVRLAELYSFVPAVLDPGEVKALHDMRIAAKRLRYILEMSEPVFGEVAASGAKEARRLQDLLGEIHDCDESIPMVERHVARLRAEDAAVVREYVEDGAKDLDPALVREAPNRAHYRGLEVLATYFEARRALLYERFLRRWERLERKDFRADIRNGIRERSATPA